MGYTTEFTGSVTVEPPLNPAEIAYLRAFADSRRMSRERGPYFVNGDGFRGQSQDSDVKGYNRPPAGQPGLWCQWVPAVDGTGIEWDGGEKFYAAEEWMRYLIDHFLKPGAEAQRAMGPSSDPVALNLASNYEVWFAGFTFDHVVNGTIDAQGERGEDRWRLVVKDNVVTRADLALTFAGGCDYDGCACRCHEVES